MKKFALLALAALLLSVSLFPAVAQDDGYTFAFVPGVNPDPFYITMRAGVMQAAADLGVEIVAQDPAEFNPTV
jgi:ABC-type sugar transport system substrate-binding protein